MIKTTGIARSLFFATLFSVSSTVAAQELEPRKYSNVPVGINFVAVGYAYNQGLIFNLSSGHTWRAGPDFDTIAVAYQYSWGGG